MDDRELTDAEWQRELREALIGFRKSGWTDRAQRARKDERRTDPWML